MKLQDYIESNKGLRDVTLCVLVNKDKILLAMKKRGFGKGRWNGVGGKCNAGETVEDAAKREAMEEIGVVLKKMEKKAVLDFYFDEDLTWNQRVHVYLVSEWKGEPKESEEMAPKWFKKDKLPLSKMWGDDIYWLPHILVGKNIKASFLFGKGDKLLEKSVSEVNNLE